MGSSPVSFKVLLILVVGCVGLLGCGEGSATSAAKTTGSTTKTPTTPMTTAPAPTTHAPATTTPSTVAPKPTTAPTTEAPAATTPPTAAPEPAKAPRAGSDFFFDEYGSQYAAFKSPSGRINCSIRDHTADCIILDNTWEVPPPDDYCDHSWGSSVEVAGTLATLTCRSDAPPLGPALPYGHEIEHGPILCRSDESGVTCDNQETSHGFKINRASFDLY